MVRRWAGPVDTDAIAADMVDDLETAAGFEADEVRWELNLSDLDPPQQVLVMEALAKRIALTPG